MTSRATRLGRRIAATVACLSITPLAIAPQQLTAQDNTFACDPGFYQVISGQLAELDPANELYNPIGDDHSNYNAIDYRVADGYIYGVASDALYRVDVNGSRTQIATLSSGAGSYAGAFDDAGLLNISRGGRDWVAVDVDTFTVTPIPEFATYTAVADITNVHGVFYGVSSDGSLYSYDQQSLAVREVGQIAGLPETLKSYGAAWSTAGGNLYVGRNSGEIYQITGYTTSAPEATLVGRAPATNSNDGASCPHAAPMAGLDDVDGPQSESEPRTSAAQAANESYTENYDEISKGFTPAETVQPEPEPEQSSEDGNTFVPADAGLGTGAVCEAGGNVDRPKREQLAQAVQVDSPTTLFETSFGGASLDDFRILSGNWSLGDGSLSQNYTCGYDYTALLRGITVTNFSWTATFRADGGFNQGGLVFHQSASNTRSGAFAVDLAAGGTVVRWGEYDHLGYHQTLGSVPIEAVGASSVTLNVTVHGNDVAISLNGAEVATTTASELGGHVGLMATLSATTFDSVSLVALPTPDEEGA